MLDGAGYPGCFVREQCVVAPLVFWLAKGPTQGTDAVVADGVLPMSGDSMWLSGSLQGNRFPARGRRSSRSRRTAVALRAEPLKGRQLLSAFTGYVHVRHIATSTGVYSIGLSDQSILKVTPAGNGQIDIKALGTTSTTDLTITQIRPRYHLPSGLLLIHNLDIKSGQIGSIDASPAELNGVMTPISTSLTTLQFGVLGAGAQVDVDGSVNSVSLGEVLLGPSGHVLIAGNINGTSTAASTSSTTASGTGSVTIQGTVTGTITATGTGSGTAPTTAATVGAMTIATVAIDGGSFVVGTDSVAPIQIQNSMTLSHNGLFSIGRDQTGSITIDGSLILDSGGELNVGRNLSSLTVDGDVLVNPGAGGIVVGGNLGGLTVNGIFRGQGSPSAVDLGVGLDLTGLTIAGGASNQGGLQSANINVGKNISEIDIPHGIFRSWVTAGVSIQGGNTATTTGLVGADGTTAIYNSEIDAGTSITNLVLGGNVTSGFPTGDETGYPTRIIAGKVRGPATGSTPNEGLYQANGIIAGFAIEGSLVDAVLAASVAPYGGDGSLPPQSAYGTAPRSAGNPPGVFTNFQVPAGLTDGTTPNYSIRNVTGSTPTGDAAWAQPAANRHDTVLSNGTIDATITGGVVSTQTDQTADTYDYAGLFAVNTVGVTTSS